MKQDCVVVYMKANDAQRFIKFKKLKSFEWLTWESAEMSCIRIPNDHPFADRVLKKFPFWVLKP